MEGGLGLFEVGDEGGIWMFLKGRDFRIFRRVGGGGLFWVFGYVKTKRRGGYACRVVENVKFR